MVLCLKTWESRSSPGLHVCEYEIPAANAVSEIITSSISLKPLASTGEGFLRSDETLNDAIGVDGLLWAGLGFTIRTA
jgi:hypothetical protein